MSNYNKARNKDPQNCKTKRWKGEMVRETDEESNIIRFYFHGYNVMFNINYL